jgi:hypothetical protein
MKKILMSFLCLICTQISQAQEIANFETPDKTPTLSGTNATVIDNPSKTGINLSNKVASYKKDAGNWKAIYLDFAGKISVGKNNRLTFKIRSSSKGRVFGKIWNGNSVVVEGWTPEYSFQPEANIWTECVMDLTAAQNQDFTRIEINASVDNQAEANVYIDDIKLFNALSPNGEPIIVLNTSATQVSINQSISFDASQSYDIDGTIQSYEWNFNDGSPLVNTPSINHTFATDGIFKVDLKITDNDNKISKKTIFIAVLPVSKLSKLTFFTPNPAKNQKVEAGFLVNANYTNVYDPDEVSIQAIITLPNQSQIIVPCFYFEKSSYQNGNDTWAKTNTQSHWMLRFSSAQSGVHKIKLNLVDKNGTTNSSEQDIIIQPNPQKGVIKIDPNNRQYYRHTTGEPYYPLGINIAWNSTSNYYKIINNLAEGKANLIRYWHASFDRQTLEWKNGSGFYKGLGIYSQEAAAEQDSILNLCEAKNMFLQMCIFHHGMFSENVNPNWNDNPYKSTNGGPLTQAEQFFYNETAKKQTKKLLRYIVARWGYSANLFAWELFNEVQFTGVHNSQSAQWASAVLNWHDEMGQYIKQLDAFKHPVTTSASDSQLLNLDAKQGLDILQYHLYNTNLLNTQNATDKSFLSNLKRTAIICGEYGLDINTADVPFDTQRIAIWTGIMNQVPHLMWLWDNYTNSVWADLFKYPAEYLNDVDFVKEGQLSDWGLTAMQGNTALGARGFSSANNFYGLVYDAGNRDNLSNVVVDFSKLKTGVYKITLHNTLTGEKVILENISIYPAKNKFTLPTFSKAIAFKVELVTNISVPIAFAGADITVGVGKSEKLTGKDSYSPSNATRNYTWELVSKPINSQLVINDSNQEEINVIPDVAGAYKLSLKLKVDNQISEADTVQLIGNANPIAQAGADKEAQVNDNIQLDGSSSSDPEKNPLTYKWTLVQSPPGSAKVLSGINTAKPILLMDAVGVFKMQLIVNDGFSESKADTVIITANPVTGLEPWIELGNPIFYPNPSSEEIKLKFTPRISNQFTLRVVDLNGKIWFNLPIETIANQPIEIAFYPQKYSLPNGVYLIQLIFKEKMMAKRIIYQVE